MHHGESKLQARAAADRAGRRQGSNVLHWFSVVGMAWALLGCGGGDDDGDGHVSDDGGTSTEQQVVIPATHREVAASSDADLTPEALETQGQYLADTVRWILVSNSWLSNTPFLSETGICPDGGIGVFGSQVYDEDGKAMTGLEDVKVGQTVSSSFQDCEGALYGADGELLHRMLAIEDHRPESYVHASTEIERIGDPQAGFAIGNSELWRHSDAEGLVRLYAVNWSLEDRAASFDLDIRRTPGVEGMRVSGGLGISGKTFRVTTRSAGLPFKPCRTAGDGCGADLVYLADAGGDRVALAFTGERSYVLSFWPSGTTTPSRVLDEARWPDDIED